MSKHRNKSFRDQPQKNTYDTMRSLKTAQEQQLEDIACSAANKSRRSRGPDITYRDLDEDEEQILNVSLGELKDTSTDKISAVINELIAKNKISAKNAFDIPMIHLNQTKEYNSLSGDNNWKKISSTLDSNNKIYGYRVDATHNYTYKVLELLTRQEKQSKNIREEEVERDEPQTNFLQFQNQEHTGDEVLFKYLEKNYKGINIVHLEVFFNVNPILQKTKRIFDQQGLRGLLLNNIEIESNLLLKLSSQQLNEQQLSMQQQLYDKKTQIAQDYSCEAMLRSENIFTKIYNICCLNDLLQKEPEDGQFVQRQDNQIDILWRQLDYLTQDKNQQDGLHPNLGDLSSEFIGADQPLQTNKQNNQIQESNVQHETNIQQGQKQSQNAQNISNLPVKTIQNSPTINQNQVNVQNGNQPQPSSVQVVTQGIVSITQNESVNKNKTQSASDEQRELVSANYSQNKPNLDEISHIQSENTPQITEFQLTKACNLTDPQLTVPRQIPISSVIRLSKKVQNSQLLLKEIQTGQQYDKEQNQGDIVETWKKGDKKVKTPRKPRKPVQKIKEQIDFLVDQNYSGKKLKQKVLRIQKVRKLELKKFMKELNTQKKFENYLYIDTSKNKLDLKITTYYREDQPFFPEPDFENNDEQPQHLELQTNMLCNQSSYIDLIDQNNANQTKTVSMKYVKHKLHSFIFEQKIQSFADIYYNFIGLEGYITPALCFLTVLHLTNEHGLRLQSLNDDIRIFQGESPTY